MASIFRKLISDMREERGMTVEQLSALCGIPADELTGMENGGAKLPFTALIRIMRAFSPSPATLLGGKVSKVCVTYASDHGTSTVEEGGMEYVPLTSAVAGGHMTPYMVSVHESWPDPQSDMTGEYFVYVLEGKVEASLAGKTYRLSVGDCAYFDSSAEHKVTNLDSSASKLLIVLD